MELLKINNGLSPVAAAEQDVSARDAQRLADQQLFASVLSRAREDQPQDPKDQARRAAEDFVAQSLVQPVLKQMRETSTAQAPFAPNQAEKAFRTMLDNALSQKIVRSGNWGLVQKVTEKIMRGAGEVPLSVGDAPLLPLSLTTNLGRMPSDFSGRTP